MAKKSLLDGWDTSLISKLVRLSCALALITVLTGKTLAQDSSRDTDTSITHNNFELIGQYARKNGFDIGGVASVFSFNVANIYGKYTPSYDIGAMHREDDIQIWEGDDYKFKLTRTSSGRITWDYRCLPLVWNREEKEQELNKLVSRLIFEIEKGK